jgi:hypothetical protein
MSRRRDREPEAKPARSRIEVALERSSPTRFVATTSCGGRPVFTDKLDPAKAKARASYASEVVGRANASGVGTFKPAQVEQAILKALGRIKDEEEAGAACPPVYRVVEHDADGDKEGIYQGDVRLTNFVLRVHEEVESRDGGETGHHFKAHVSLLGVTRELSISTEEWANDTRFMAALYGAAGARLQLSGKPEALRRAVAALSDPRRTTSTTDFGWTANGDAFLSPSVRIDARGIHPTGPEDPLRVVLVDECARHLDLAVPLDGEIGGLKRHVARDLLRLSTRRVTYAMMAATALAVLLRFAPSMNRPMLWLVGVTGSGKSFLMRLCGSFFGDFPVEDGARTASWMSTANFIQSLGYLFKDTLFGIDDYKPELVRHADLLKIIQNGADGSARGRLRSDARAIVPRPIRGIVVSTGEETPQQSASSIARTVVIRVPSRDKDRDRGARCLDLRRRYPALTAAFIEHLLAEGRTALFAGRVAEYTRLYYDDIVGRQNDLRIAGNLALLAAAFAEFAEFLGEALPKGEDKVAWFVDELKSVRDEMLDEVVDQQPSEIFLVALRALASSGAIRIDGRTVGSAGDRDHRPLVARIVASSAPGRRPLAQVSTQLALRSVQEHLRAMGKPPLALTKRASSASWPPTASCSAATARRGARAQPPSRRGRRSSTARARWSSASTHAS